MPEPKDAKGDLVHSDDNGVFIIRDNAIWRPSPTDHAITGSSYRHYMRMEDRGLGYIGTFCPENPSDSLIVAGTRVKTRIVRKYDQLYVSRSSGPEAVEELWHRHGPIGAASSQQPYVPYDMARIQSKGWNLV